MVRSRWKKFKNLWPGPVHEPRALMRYHPSYPAIDLKNYWRCRFPGSFDNGKAVASTREDGRTQAI